MLVWLRLLIVACIAIALPLQGIAGVTMAHCAKSQARVVHIHSGMPLALAADDLAQAHRHHAAADTPAAEQTGLATAAHALAPPEQPADLSPHKCSSCAACCAASAPPSAMPVVPKLACAPADFAESILTIDPFASDGPDRPPRSTVAA
jgi:hypothetical protein